MAGPPRWYAESKGARCIRGSIQVTRPTLLAVSAYEPWPILNGYVLRVANLIDVLVKSWDIVLITPHAAGAAEWTVGGRLRDWRAPELTKRGLALGLFREDRDRLVDETQEAVREHDPVACLLWAGAEFLALGNKQFPPTVTDRIDAFALHEWRRAKAARDLSGRVSGFREAVRWAWIERKIVHGTSVTVVAAEDDAATLRRLAPRDAERIVVVPNGVELKSFDDLSSLDERPTVVFTGTLDYPPNEEAAVHFATRVWPRVREKASSGRFIIAGRRPGSRIMELTTIPGVEVHADVPDLTRVMRRAWMAVAPMLSGSGIKNKVLEAWAVGRPVVMYELCTSGLNLEGASAELVGSDEDEMVALIERLIQDRAELARQARAAHEAARARSWATAGKQISDQLMSITSEKGVP